MKKPDGFIGKDAVVAKKGLGPMTRRIAQILIKDPKPMMFHAEVVRRNGKPAGYVRAASYGFSLGGAVGLMMIEGGGEVVDQAFLDKGTWEVEIAGKLFPAVASLKPLYDPENKKIKG